MSCDGVKICGMVVHREVIQALRAKRSAEMFERLQSEGQEQLMTLLAQSGLLERGVDPRTLNLSPEQRDALIQAAEAQLHPDSTQDEVKTRQAVRGRTSV